MAGGGISPSLIDHFSALSDPRQAGKVLYPLREILLVVLCATMAGAEDFVEIQPWGGASSTSSAGSCPSRAASRAMTR